LLQDGPIDLLCFTGDIADWGQPQEYAAVTDFVHTLLDRLHLEHDRLFLVPGNHDIARLVEADAWHSLRDKMAAGADAQGLSRWMAGDPHPPLGIEPGWREQVLARQAAYRDWLQDMLGRPDLAPAQSPHGLLGYRKTLRLHGWDFDIHILGLDTAWL